LRIDGAYTDRFGHSGIDTRLALATPNGNANHDDLGIRIPPVAGKLERQNHHH